MRNPTPPERTTIAWQIDQAWRRTRISRSLRAFGEWWSNRCRITRRFPKTTAVIAFFVSLAVSVFIYFVILLLLARVD